MSVNLKVSPLAPKNFPDMYPISGVRFATVNAGMKSGDGEDVTLIVLEAERLFSLVYLFLLVQTWKIIL